MPIPSSLRLAALSGATLALILSGCADKPPTNPLLQQVPADTPYLMQTSKPLPDGLYDRLLAMGNSQLAQAQRDWGALAEQLEKARRESGGQPTPAQQQAQRTLTIMQALAAELAGKFDRAGMASLGFDPQARSVLYGLGPFPVLRTEVADAAKVEALLARVEARSGHTAEHAQLDGRDYRRVALGQRMVMLLSLHDNQLVVGLLPSAAEADLLPLVLGSRTPDHALADGDTLAQLQDRYGYPGHAEGYLDIQRLTVLLTGRGEDPAGRAWRDLTAGRSLPSPGCRRLLDGMAAGMPRIAVGMNEVSDHGYTVSGAYETSPAVATQLQQLARPTPLPGMGMTDDALFSMGLDLNMPALRTALKALGQYVAQTGRDCAWVDADAIRTGLPKLDFMLGPMLGGLSGAYLQLADVRLNEQTLAPEALNGGVLLAVSDPQGMVSMAGMMNPALASLELPADGKPVAVPAELLPPQVSELHLAGGDGVLAVAAGQGSAQRVQAMLAAGHSPEPVLMTLGYDIGRFMTVMDKLLGLTAERLQAAGEVEQAAMLREQAAGMQSLGEHLGRMDLWLAPDAGGLRMRQRVELR